MAYVNDSQTLADVVGGASAAAQMGIQNDQANQADTLKNQLSQNTLAADSAAPGLKNMFMQSQTANENAVGQQNQQTADMTKSTMGGAVDATNSTNALTISGNQAKSIGQVGQIAGQLSGMMRQIPAAARPAAMAQMAQSYGIDTSKLGPLMSGDPDMLDQVSQQANQHTAAYQEQMLKGNQEYTRNIDSTKALVQGRTDVAGISAQARTDAATISAQQRQQSYQNTKGQLTAKVANGTATPQERATLTWLMQGEQLQKSGNAMASSMMGLDTQSNIPDAPGGGSAPSGGGGSPQPVQGDAVGQLAQSKFGSYDQSKYTYVQAMNPKTGKMDLGRIPK